MKKIYLLFFMFFFSAPSMALNFGSLDEINQYLSQDLATYELTSDISSATNLYMAEQLKEAKRHAQEGNLKEANKALYQGYMGQITTITFPVKGEMKECKFLLNTITRVEKSLGCF